MFRYVHQLGANFVCLSLGAERRVQWSFHWKHRPVVAENQADETCVRERWAEGRWFHFSSDVRNICSLS